MQDIFILKTATGIIFKQQLVSLRSCNTTRSHEIVFAKLNLKVEYPPPYERVFWDYSRVDKASMNSAISAIDWDELFANKTVEFQVSELNDLLLNIYSNYVPNKTVLCDDKDPPWMTNGIRTVVEIKNNAYKEYIRSGMRHNHFVCLENLTTELSNLIRYSKLAAKLVNPSTNAKTYWSILKTFANGRKVPVPLLINNEFISNFKTKANYFNRFFNQQCAVVSTDSSIPSSVILATNKTATTIIFDEQLISKLIVDLNPNKAHGHDGLSICMLQIGSGSISKPLSIIFRNCLKDGFQQTFQRCLNIVFCLMRRRDVGQRQINVETTLCISTLEFTTSNNVESTLCISTMI